MMEVWSKHSLDSTVSALAHPRGIRRAASGYLPPDSRSLRRLRKSLGRRTLAARLNAMSRWLSGATPPESRRTEGSHPGGMTEDRRLLQPMSCIPFAIDRVPQKQFSAGLSDAFWHPCRDRASQGRSTGKILVSGLQLGAASLFVPPGTPDNSPPLQRWDSLSSSHSPGRGDRPFPHSIAAPLASPPISQASAVPQGTRRFVRIAFPPLKRWAIVGCPWRDKIRSFRWKNSHRKPYPCRDAGLEGASSAGRIAAINHRLMAGTPAGVGASLALIKISSLGGHRSCSLS